MTDNYSKCPKLHIVDTSIKSELQNVYNSVKKNHFVTTCYHRISALKDNNIINISNRLVKALFIVILLPIVVKASVILMETTLGNSDTPHAQTPVIDFMTALKL